MAAQKDKSNGNAKRDGRRLGAIYQVSLHLAAIAMVFGELPPRADDAITSWIRFDLAATSIWAAITIGIWIDRDGLRAYSRAVFIGVLGAILRDQPIRHITLSVFLFALYYNNEILIFGIYLILFSISDFLLIQRRAPAYVARQQGRVKAI